ncbi:MULTISPECIES: peptide deformylase [Flavobacterium]|jgi:peptide deformylase|uniref:Peptide deformylase n=1 Tax=Flavobacterium cupriresistens TaxID=2893885 RepID=A0ABU4R7H1_9FLAO|nr:MULTISPECIES: peptide deformylase [unclassified Flavobacterium]KLT70009.1 peptide deformylase [Flavobacterium sp. ABG]MDX6188186.1 peptide deformylase [Flavobacterium sp. Fl-318]UFH40770.1 peptide deformylase [Flavobacterium sp. F-323]
MILPIVGYGDPVLRKVCEVITPEYPNLKEILANMYETMYNAYGVGLAAPQVGIAIRLFVIDTTPFSDDEDYSTEEQNKLKGFKKTFINARIVKEEGEEWSFNEGCLSIPDVREDVYRKPTVTIEYCEEDFVVKTEVFDGLIARVIQHEYDHIEGVLFTDKISSLKKRLIQKKLKNITEGKTFQDYKMKFVAAKKGR